MRTPPPPRQPQSPAVLVTNLTLACLLATGCGVDLNPLSSSGSSHGGQPTSGAATANPTSNQAASGAQYSTNMAVLGRDQPNLLKGMAVGSDVVNNRVFVSAIMTPHIGVIDATTNKLTAIWELPMEALGVKRLAYNATTNRLWLVSGHGTYMAIVDATDGTILAQQSFQVAQGTPDYPISQIALDPATRRLFLTYRASNTTDHVAVYDDNLQEQSRMLQDRSVIALRWDSNRDALVALTAPRRGAGEILVLPQGDEQQATSIPAPQASHTGPPQHLDIAPGGDFIVGGSAIWRIGARGQVKWYVPPAGNFSAMAVSGSEVGVVYKTGFVGSSDSEKARVATYDLDSGQFLALRFTRYEASHMAGLAQGGFAVGNGGDASVSLLPAGTAAATTVDVGTAAEDIVLTADGKRLLVLNRLGGSQLIDFDLASGQSTVHDTLAWPMRMAAQVSGDKLFVLSHLTSQIEVRKLSDLSAASTISLGLPGSISDTVSDMVADSKGELLAALMCEQGKVVVVDGIGEQVLATIDLGRTTYGGGPGRMRACIDSTNNRIFVYVKDDSRLYVLDGRQNYQIVASETVGIDRDVIQSYAFKGLHYSDALDTLFVMNLALDPTTLTQTASITGVHRIVAEDAGTLYGQFVENDEEVLVKIDPSTLAVVERSALQPAVKIKSYLSFDFTNRRLAVSQPSAAVVAVQDLK